MRARQRPRKRLIRKRKKCLRQPDRRGGGGGGGGRENRRGRRERERWEGMEGSEGEVRVLDRKQSVIFV